MAYGNDFGGFEAAVEAAAEREEAEMDAMAEAEMAEEAEMNAAVGGIGNGNRPGPGFRDGGFIERSTTAQGGIGTGRIGPGFDGYDYNDDVLDATGLLDANFQSDFATPGGGGWSSQGLLDQARVDAQETAAGLDIVNQEGRLDRWGNAIDRFFGMPQDVISQIDTFTEIDPTTGNVHHSDGRITDGTTGQTIQEPTRDWKEPWYMDRPNQDRVNREEDRDDSASEYACEASGGTWDGGSCVMPEDDEDDDDNGDIDYGKFGKPDPFASINRERQMWYHPMMGGTGHGQVYDPYSGERPDYISESIWDYKPPRGGAEFKNWASDLRKWASGS